MMELIIHANEHTFEIKNKDIQFKKSITLFKKKKLSDKSATIPLTGVDDSDTIKFKFRDQDPNITVVAECFNKMFEDSKTLKPQPRRTLPEHSPSIKPRPCSLIREDTFKSVCSSENKNSQANDYLNTKVVKELYPMDAMKKQAAALSLSPAKSPLKPKNEIGSKLGHIMNCMDEGSYKSPTVESSTVSLPKNYKLQTTPKSYSRANTSAPKILTEGQSPKLRPSVKRKSDIFADDDIVVVNSPIQRRKKIEATPLPVLSKIKNENSSSEVDRFAHRKLVNIGNSCYMNSTFQALSALDQFTFRMRQVYLSLTTYRSNSVKKMSPGGQQKLGLLKLTCQILYNLGATCSTSSRKLVQIEESVLNDVRKTIGKENSDFDNHFQQDAHEFLLVYCSQIETTIRRVAKKLYRDDYGELPEENSDEFLLNHCEFRKLCPSDTFLLKTEMKLVCIHCGHSRTQSQGAQLDVNATVRKNRNLQELVDESFPCNQNPDVICDKCSGRGAKMSSRISQFPESLVVSLKRYKSYNNTTKKCATLVPVTTILYTNKCAEFQDDVMEFSDDEIDLDLDIKVDEEDVIVTCSPKSPAMDETQKKSSKETPTPPKSTGRRSSASNHFDLFCEKSNDEDVYFDCNTNMDNNSGYAAYLCDKALEEEQATKEEDVKLLGGADSIEKTVKRGDSDFEILEAKICSTIMFEPLNDYQQVLDILAEINIKFDDADELRNHLTTLPAEKVEISINEQPATCPVEGDGNCFYRCISYLLTSSENYHDDFRTKNVELIQNNTEQFASTTHEPISAIVKRAGKMYEWSNEVEIIAMCTLLKCDIYTFLDGRWARYQPKWVDGEKRNASLYLKNKGSVHFEPVVGLAKTSSRGTKRTSARLSKNDGNDDIYLPDDDNDEMPGSRPRLSRSCKNVANYSETGTGTASKRGGRKTEVNQGNEKKTTKKSRLEDEIDWKMANGSPVYVLSSIVCHQGSSLNSGHYVAYTRNATTNEWVYCSDEVVYSVSEKRALTDCAEKGYVFYYSKVSQ